jgi:UPF0176 protein
MMMTYSVAALYHFTRFDDPAVVHPGVLALCKTHGIKGTILLAQEGINGTIAGLAADIEAVVADLRALPGCATMDVKYSHAETMPFFRLKVRVKREIVTLGQPGVDPTRDVGTYVDPADWNALITDPETVVIDTRNAYEVRIGSFAGAIDPQTESFREFPDWFRANRDDVLAGKKRVAMFCTGGIRCEKSTSFLKSEGVEDVYHLRGGILRYLEEMPEEESTWQGDCFVFDQRVAVTHGLEIGTHSKCHACRDPLSPEDLASPLYLEGISCPHCHGSRDAEARKGYAEREKQMQLAAQRGEDHIGVSRHKQDG